MSRCDRLSADYLARNDAAERLAEIAQILSAGLMRLFARQSSEEADFSENCSLHFTADQSAVSNSDHPEDQWT